MKSKTISGIRSFIATPSELIYCDMSSSLLFRDIKIEHVDCQSLVLYDTELHFEDSEESKPFFINLNDDAITVFKKEYNYDPRLVSDNKVLVCNDFKVQNGIVHFINYVYDIVDKSLRRITSIDTFSSFEQFSTLAIGKSHVQMGGEQDEKIIAISVSIDTVIWEFDCKSLGPYISGIIEKENRITHYAGQFNGNLIFSLESGGTLMLDANSGNIKEYWPNTLVTYNLQSTSNSAIFWGASYMTFIEVDADRGVLNVQFDLTEELKRMANIPAESPNWVGIHTGVIHDNLIYFLADINYLGIFDPSQKKIIWWHKFQFEIKSTMLKNGTESFCVTNNKIYVLDNSNTLHIFEKENQN